MKTENNKFPILNSFSTNLSYICKYLVAAMPLSDILVNVKRLRYYPVMESGPFYDTGMIDNERSRPSVYISTL